MPYFPNSSALETPQTQVSGTDAGIAVRPIDQANGSEPFAVSGSLSIVPLLLPNPARIGATFYNHHNKGNLYLQLGVFPSGSYTVKMAPESYYELPKPVHVGQVQGYWDNVSGLAPVCQITELT